MSNYEKEADRLDTLAMDIIVHAGDARNYMIKSLEALSVDWDFEKAEEALKKATAEIVIAHGMQTSTLQLEAAGETIRYSTLFNHAQDTLMTAQSEILMAKNMVNLFKAKN